MKKKENFELKYKDNNINKNIKIKLSLLNGKKINLKLSLDDIIYEISFESFDFKSFDYFEDFSPIQIFENIKNNLFPENIQIKHDLNNNFIINVSILIKTEFDKEKFSFNMKLLNNDNNNEKLDEVLIQHEKEIIQNNNINEKEKKDEIINFSFDNKICLIKKKYKQ